MAVPFATAQLVRYVTDKVLENVTRQLQQRSASKLLAAGQETDEAVLRQVTPELMEAIGQLNTNLIKLRNDLQDLREDVSELDTRLTRMEGRWGFYALLRVLLIVTLAFVLGIGFAQLLRWGGWF